MHSRFKIALYVALSYIVILLIGAMAGAFFLVMGISVVICLYIMYKYGQIYETSKTEDKTIHQTDIKDTIKVSGTVRDSDNQIHTPFMQDDSVFCKWTVQEVVGHGGKTGYSWNTVDSGIESTTFVMETDEGNKCRVNISDEDYRTGHVFLVDNLNRVVCADGENPKDASHPSGLANEVIHSEGTPEHIKSFLSERGINEFNTNLDGRNRFMDNIGRLAHYDNGTRRYSEKSISVGDNIYLYGELKEKNITEASVVGSPTSDEQVVMSDNPDYDETSYIVYKTARYLSIAILVSFLFVVVPEYMERLVSSIYS